MYELIYEYMNHRRIKKVYAESEAEAIELFEIWADGLDEFVDLTEVKEGRKMKTYEYGKWELKYACNKCNQVGENWYHPHVVGVCSECGAMDISLTPVAARRVTIYRWFNSPIHTWEVKEQESEAK